MAMMFGLLNGESRSKGARPAQVVVVQRRGERCTVLIAAAANGGVEVRTAAECPAASLASLLEANRGPTVVSVLPARSTICRVATVPEGEWSEVSAALSLVAEGDLPESLPAHRRASGLIAGAAPDGMRVGLLTGWPTSREDGSVVDGSWCVPAVAALAALDDRGELGASWHLEGDSGALSIVTRGPTRALARVTVAGREGAARAIAESCAAVGVEGPRAHDAETSVPEAVVRRLASRVVGVQVDRAWIATYGLALGAAMVTLADNPAVRSLAGLRREAESVREPALLRAATWLGKPRHAWSVVAAGVALMILGPLVLAEARGLISKWRAGDYAAAREELDQVQLLSALYNELDQRRLPMTKLLADLAGAMPVGIVVESVRLSGEQGLVVSGVAQEASLVNTLQANLNGTGVFGEVRVSRSQAGEGGEVAFDVSAQIGRAHARAKPAEDFAATPLAVRLYGEGASNTTAPAGESRASATRTNGTTRTTGSTPTIGRSESAGDRGASRGEELTSRRPSGAPAEPPPPLTDEQIASMDRATATQEFLARRTFPQNNPSIEDSVKRRLEDEVTRLRSRLDALRGGG